MKDLYSFLEELSQNSNFNAELSKRGGFITFSNSGRRGGVKYFQIGLDSILQTLKDILDNLVVFHDLTEYEEKAWRDNGSEFFNDPVANANSTVQTKPLFSTLSKVIIWGNQPRLNDINPDETIVLDEMSLTTAINKLEMVANSFSPKKLTLTEIKHNLPLQQIFYGAPGTGKSHTINEITETQPKENVFRTTFHPDSDYSTFVGCYKPTKIKTRRQQRMNLSLEDLAKELGSYYSNEELGKISGIQKFCYEYYPYIDGEYMSVNVTKLLELAGIPKDYNVEINKYVKFCHLFPKQDPDKITYEFVPQTFTKAYLRAWQTEEPVYLVIEEINRGNCAQIFGDLFQILDRKNGMSEYPIKADNDLAAYIGEQLSKESREGIPETVKSGEELILPSNLYIWATMNTSDQSLFPIDSAFKRRWEWKYLPINNHEDKNYKIEAGNNKYDWWGFLSKINEVIGNTTSSEDKKLGYFFAKADENGIVNAEQFVGKVLFYLWNDVFKNYGFDNQIFDKGDEKKFEFSDFFKQDGNPDTDMVIRFLKKLDETVDKENSFDEKIKGDKGQEELSDTEA